MNPRQRAFTILGWAVWTVTKSSAKRKFAPKPSKLKRLVVAVTVVGAVAGAVAVVRVSLDEQA